MPTIQSQRDYQEVTLSGLATVACAITWTFCAATGVSSLAYLSIILLLFTLILATINGTIADPRTIFCIVLFQYSYMPTIASPFDRFLRLFPLGGADYISCAAIITTIAGVGIAAYIIPGKSKQITSDSAKSSTGVFQLASVMCAGLSLALSIVYASQRGFVVGGGVVYADTFSDNRTEGSGLLLLSVPLAIAGMSFILSTKPKITNMLVIFSIISFAALFIVHGQRKYFIIPALLLSSNYIRINSFLGLVSLVGSVAVSYFAFMYVGFVRTYEVPFELYFDPITFDRFLLDLPNQIAGESPAVFGTAAAAFSGFVTSLPYFGDYSMAWVMSLPHAISQGSFVSLNDRFSYAVDPQTAALGYGWGFSFWGEAYLVGGTIGIAIVGLITSLGLRYLYVSGTETYRTPNIRSVILISALYHVLWIQRNAFAYTLKGFIVNQIVVVIVVYVLANRIHSDVAAKEGEVGSRHR